MNVGYFFFSSRRRHTRSDCDWSSDVCSSDLETSKPFTQGKPSIATPPNQTRLWMYLGEVMDVKPIDIVNAVAGETGLPGKVRSEERRVGKECRSWRAAEH